MAGKNRARPSISSTAALDFSEPLCVSEKARIAHGSAPRLCCFLKTIRLRLAGPRRCLGGPADQPPMPIKFSLRAANGQEYPITGPFRIGREPECQIQI